jgi:PH (Pleckstrin Homology) domain-containing protein
MGLFSIRREEAISEDSYKQATPSRPTATASIQSRQEVQLSGDLLARHEESLRKYPRVHLSKGEYVIMEVRRHPIGLLSIWLLTGLLVVAVLALIPFYGMNRGTIASTLHASLGRLPTPDVLTFPLLALAIFFLLGGLVAVYIYNSNLFYLTNESIIQYAQTGLMTTAQQQINLVNVDDVSYRQQGIMQQVLNYGTIRVSTEGDDRNPYIFYFVAHPQLVTQTINDAMEEATGFAVRFRQHRDQTQQDSTLPPPEQF